MAKILTRTDSVVAGDLIVLYKTNQGDYRGVSTSDFLDFIRESLGQSTFVTQSMVVSSSGFNVTVADNGSSIWLILRLTDAFAAGTITLPSLANSVDGQEVMVISTRVITALTVDGNGAVEVVGEPSTVAAEGFFKLRFDALSSSWYRVG